MSNKKIMCLIDCLGSGGAQRQIVGLAKMLNEKNYNVSVITYHDIPFYKNILEDAKIYNYSIPETKNKIQLIIKLNAIVKSLSPDIIVAYQETPSILACIIKLLHKKIKIIVSERNTSQQFRIKEKIRFYLYTFSNYIVPNSYTQANQIRNKFPFLKDKIVVITNYVDTNHFHPQIVDNKIPVICIVASEKKEKNFNTFIKAVAILQNRGKLFSVKWYGINNKYIKNHQDRINEMGINKIMTIYPPQTNIETIYNHSDFFCLPSIFEGYPNTLCEAMSCGLPVAVSSVCDNATIVTNNENGVLFNPKSENDIADKLEMLLGFDPKTIQTIRNNNRIKAVGLFSMDTFISKYINIIEK